MNVIDPMVPSYVRRFEKWISDDKNKKLVEENALFYETTPETFIELMLTDALFAYNARRLEVIHG